MIEPCLLNILEFLIDVRYRLLYCIISRILLVIPNPVWSYTILKWKILLFRSIYARKDRNITIYLIVQDIKNRLLLESNFNFLHFCWRIIVKEIFIKKFRISMIYKAKKHYNIIYVFFIHSNQTNKRKMFHKTWSIQDEL